MGSYLDRLKALDAKKCLPWALSKLPEAPFDSKDGPGGRHFPENPRSLATAPLSATHQAAMVRWLDAFGETGSGELSRVLDCCRADPEALAYVLEMAPPECLPTALSKLPERPALGELRATRIDADRLAREAAIEYHRHLFGPGKAMNCCYARSGRYCPEGSRLRAEYRRRVVEIRGEAHD